MSNTRYKSIHDKVQNGHAVYMPYVLIGYPDLDASIAAAKTLIDNGADGLEIGIPFRDPVADGPVIEAAANHALDNGFKVDQIITFIREIRSYAPTTPLTLMSYYNIILAKKPEIFLTTLANAGLDGILIPDLPPEHAEDIYPLTQKAGLEMVFIVAPTSDASRFAKITPYAGGFIYVVTKMGITGMQDQYDQNLAALFKTIKAHFALPAIAGFGISTAQNAQDMVKNGADGVIIGSKIIKLCEESYKEGKLSPALLSAHTQEIINAL
ncbi:MAG: tryptophan synthase subunit alpha [Alphaproteobacteria bacterium]|nr:tryptophan synthase subunit alpha [Alphaproteobacteria bacterium]